MPVGTCYNVGMRPIAINTSLCCYVVKAFSVLFTKFNLLKRCGANLQNCRVQWCVRTVEGSYKQQACEVCFETLGNGEGGAVYPVLQITHLYIRYMIISRIQRTEQARVEFLC